MVPVRNASSQEMIALSVCPQLGRIVGIMLTLFQLWDSVHTHSIWYAVNAQHSGPITLTSTKHCLDTWINQESSQGRCPMCRQGMRSQTSLVDHSGIMVLIETVFRIKGTVDQSEVQPEQTAQS
jgi:hypothetical protein